MELNEKIDDDSFILANLDMAGFYRVSYDENNWGKLIYQLQTNSKVYNLINNCEYLFK